jgi:SAM-dependent methyltransferase
MIALLGRIERLLPARVRQAIPPSIRQRLLEALGRGLVFYRLLRRKRSRFVSGYLDGLKGIEIGASSHNSFFLDAINVDRYPGEDTPYKRLERQLAGRIAPVDIVAPGDELPFGDDSYDFVFASHVIEHFPDPARALHEWRRVARRYVVVVAPHRDRTFDKDRDLTSNEEILERHRNGFSSEEDKHWTVWSCESFISMCDALGLRVIDHQDPDDKVGNGFTIVIDALTRQPAEGAKEPVPSQG